MKPRASSTVAAMLLAASLAGPVAARAQERPETPIAMQRRGFALERAGEHERAIEVLRRVIEVRPTVRALATLAEAEHALGRMEAAEEHLAAALRLNRGRWIRRNRARIEHLLMVIQSSAGTVRVTSNLDDAEILLDGRVIGRTPMREGVRLYAGRVTLTVRSPGYVTTTRDVEVVPGREVQSHVVLERDAPTRGRVAAVSAQPAEDEVRCAAGMVLRDGLCHMVALPANADTSPFRWMAYVGAGLAVASASLAVGLWADGNSIEGQYIEYCGGPGAPRSCVALQREAQDTLSSHATLVNAVWVFSAVSLGTAVVGLVLDLTRARPPRESARTGLSLAPAGLRLTW